MAVNTSEDKFLKYLGDISKSMIDEKSSVAMQIRKVEEQFLKFGLTNEQFSTVIAEINKAGTQYMTQYANASAMELLKIEINQPLLDAEIELKRKELELKDKELALKDKELEIKDKDLELKTKELEIKEQELAIKREELKLKQQEVLESQAKVKLINAQVTTEGKQQGMIVAQTALVARQTKGYGDNLYVKAGEFEGSLASFAVNSAPTNPTTNTAIAAFRSTIAQIKARA